MAFDPQLLTLNRLVQFDANNQLTMGEVDQLADRGFPVMQLLADRYGVPAEEARRMVERGEVPSTGDGEGKLSRLGLMFHASLDRLLYWCTPANSHSFASTGGDGTHYSLVDLGDGPSEDSPIVMTVPMAIPGPDHDLDPNRIVGATLHEFLALGVDIGYFCLEQLAYQPDFPSEIESARDHARDPVLQQLADAFDLSSWRDVAGRLDELSQAFGPALQGRPVEQGPS